MATPTLVSHTNHEIKHGIATLLSQVPPLKLFISNTEMSQYCMSDSVILNSLTPIKQTGDWFYMSVPLSLFGCSVYPGTAQLDRFDFYNQDTNNALFCLADVQIMQ